jgi:hypothetical protein
MSTTTLKLKLVDVLGNALDDHAVSIDLFTRDNSRHFQARVPLDGQTQVTVTLTDARSDIYRVSLTSTNYRMLQFFIRLNEGATTERAEPAVFPVNPDRVLAISAPDFFRLDSTLQRVLRESNAPVNGGVAQSGQELYNGLRPILKAALLNFSTKSAATRLGDGTSCLDHVQSLLELHPDRLFAKVDAALVEETMQSTDFRPADFSLHREIPPYRVFASFKTRDARGNLQLTFSRDGDTGANYLVDMDIDEGQGIEHAFEVIRNSVAGLTSPYNVREILIKDQELQPLYAFQFAERGPAEISAAAVTG